MAGMYTYPHDIKDNKYAFRKVTIKVKKQVSEQSAKEAYEKSLEQFKQDAEKVRSDASTVAGVQSNLKANSKASEFNTDAVIVLPLPNTFSDQQSHGWSTETGIIGTIGRAMTNASATGLAGKALGAAGAAAGGRVGAAASGAGAIVGAAPDISIDKVLGASSSALGLRKPLIDPGYFQNYTGSEPREFTMVWDLVPSSGAEANDIVMIIMKLKEYSSPQKMVNGVSLYAPYFFSIEFGNPFISAMAKIDRVVIKNISVDYGADGFMQQHFDGMPKHMSLSLTFAEVDMSTADDYNSQKVPKGK